MQSTLRRQFFLRAACIGAFCIANPDALLSAQGLTGASVRGIVRNQLGQPVPSALVSLRNLETGVELRSTVSQDGNFIFENVPVGGPYRLDARAIGFAPATIGGIILHLGDRLTQNIPLGATQVHELDSVLVRGSAIRDAGAGGPAYSISRAAIRALPLSNRDFVGLLAMAPQAVGASALSISGQHPRFNSIQVDGASINDFFGTQVTPGANVGAKMISLEALEEIRILVAPFDVRQGDFSGGLINAVTRSGTNQFHATAFSSFARASLVGRDTSGARANDFDIAQYGFSAAGPIVRDKLHFFTVTDLQSSAAPFIGPAAGDPTTGISEEGARRVEQIFHDVYGFSSGGPSSPTLRNPNANLFGKLSWQPAENHLVEFAQSWIYGKSDVLTRVLGGRDGWQLSESGSTAASTSNITRLKVTSIWRRLNNELNASFRSSKIRSRSNLHLPVFLVQADLGTTNIAGGGVRNAQDVNTDQRIIEISDNLSFTRGAHLFTFGTQNELVQINDNFFLGKWGAWTFASATALERRDPVKYEIALPLQGDGPIADYPATLVAGYAQDRWSATQRLTFTAGARVDVPFFPSPGRNASLLSNDALGNIDTGKFPSGNAVFSPRVAFAWQLGDRGETLLRSGIGGFTGRPLFAWLTSAYANTGVEQALLTCTRAQGVPAPTTDLSRLPTRCTGTQPVLPLATVSIFSPDFKFQQALKYTIGLDHDFGQGYSAAFDAIHTRTLNHLVVTDANLVEEGLSAEGRMMYGFSTGGVLHTSRLDGANFGPIYKFSNRSADRSTSLSVSFTKRWSSAAQIDAGYNWSRTEDVMSLSGALGPNILQSNPVDGTLARRTLRRSARDIPHNFVATAIAPIGWGFSGSLFFRARSGAPYAYAINGDANADSVIVGGGNDLVYAPKDASDISLTNPNLYPALDAFIEQEPCLREQRGRIMKRNSCRNPAVTVLDGRLTKELSIGLRKLSMYADLFNIPNMLNKNWGLVRESSNAEIKRGLLSTSGWDAANNRPRYTVPNANGVAVLPNLMTVVVDLSRWKMQIGARYSY